MSQSTAALMIESNYAYEIGNAQGKILDFTHNIIDGSWRQNELQTIAQELKSMAQEFAIQQGMGPDTRIYQAIEAVPTNNGVNFFNDAIDDWGRYYAGHVEYGHHDRAGDFVPARPFMRPAMMTVRESTLGRASSSLRTMWEGVMGGSPSYMGKQTFGVNTSSYKRAFYSKTTPGQYTKGVVSKNTKGTEQVGKSSFWQGMSVKRGDSNYGSSSYHTQHVGWG